MARFEKVSRFADIDIAVPCRKTAQSAGYDFVVAEDIIIEPYVDLLQQMETFKEIRDLEGPMNINTVSDITKMCETRPQLVSTGMKCALDEGTYLELSVRSSSPLKYWLVMANGVGIIDADYYQNPDNEGEIFFQLINLSPFPIYLKRGDAIGQGIIKRYGTVEYDVPGGERKGGFGSTSDS